jgi:phosphatidylglycerophosphate synthase
MQLHRADGNDWDGVAVSDRNVWQRLAARTGGLASPGNAVTVAGGVIVVIALVLLANHRSTWLAVAMLMLGRLADLLDGHVASWTGTKSPVGEAFDAVVDKLEICLAAVVLWLLSLVPGVVFAVFVVHALYNFGLTFLDFVTNRKLHPTQAGKLAAAAEWIAIGLFVLDSGLKLSGNWHLVTVSAAWILFVIFAALGVVSSLGYTAQLRNRRGKK